MNKDSENNIVGNSKPWLLSAAAIAGVVSRSIVHPMDTLRANMMTWQRTTASGPTPNLQSLWNTFVYLLRQSGFKGLYRGYGISVLVQAPAVATYLTTYDVGKAWLSTNWDKYSTWFASSSPLVHLCSGFCAEAVSGFFWVPMEVLKQRVQVGYCWLLR